MTRRLSSPLRLSAVLLGIAGTLGSAAGSPSSPQVGVCIGCAPSADGFSYAFNSETQALLTVFVHVDAGICLDTWDASDPCFELPCTAFMHVNCAGIPVGSRALTTWYGYPDGTEKGRNTIALPGANTSLPGLPVAVSCGKTFSVNASLPDVGSASVEAFCTECSNE